MRILNTILSRTHSVRALVCLFASSHAILLMMMAYTFPKINSKIGGAAFDLRPLGYSVFEARSILSRLDAPTIDLYLFPQLTLLDLLYPALLALFLSSFLFRLVKVTKSKPYSFLLIAPFVAMVFDYLENTCIILMITHKAEISESILRLSSIFTISKGILTSVAWVGILCYGLKWARMRLAEKKESRA